MCIHTTKNRINTMNTSANESSIKDLLATANQKKGADAGRAALNATQAKNNKSAPQEPQPEPKEAEVGKRRNVYFSPKSLSNLNTIDEMDGVGMSAAIQAALYLFANATDKKREQVYRDLKIKCNFDK